MRVHSVSEDEGGAVTDWDRSDRPCHHCKVVGRYHSRVWESNDGTYLDERFECLACGKNLWVEVIDSGLAVGRSSRPGVSSPDRSRWMDTARPLIAIACVCSVIGFEALREVARRFGS